MDYLNIRINTQHLIDFQASIELIMMIPETLV